MRTSAPWRLRKLSRNRAPPPFAAVSISSRKYAIKIGIPRESSRSRVREELFQSPDFQEGLRAFKEKRAPKWPSIESYD